MTRLSSGVNLPVKAARRWAWRTRCPAEAHGRAEAGLAGSSRESGGGGGGSSCY